MPLGKFDDQPALTFGCDNLDTCFALIPVRPLSDTVLVSDAINTTTVDSISGALFQTGLDTGTLTQTVFAVFTPAQVPEPASLALIGVALAGLGFNQRKRTAN